MAETGMIERVARAIYAKRNGQGAKPWSLLTIAHRTPYLDDARAAVEALREPSEAQMQIFRHFFGFNPFVKDGGPADRLFANAYRQSVDAILSESDRPAIEGQSRSGVGGRSR